MDINNKTIVISGAARGIGQSIAEHIGKLGGRVALLDLDQQTLDATVAEMSESGIEARGYVCNVADEEAVVATFLQINSDFGAIHGLVNNAGVLRDATLVKVKDGRVVKKMTAEEFDLVIDVHLKGAFLCTREAVTYMIENQIDEGCIVSMSSVAYRGNFGQTNYSAAKAGIVAMSRVWSKELARYNIRSMAIAPGSIETDMLRSMPPKALELMAQAVPLGRIGQVKHIAQAVIDIFENDYLTGGVIDVNGGLFI